MADTLRYLDQRRFRSIDSMPIRETDVAMLDLDKVQAHITHAITRNRYTGPTDLLAYLQHKQCLVADGDRLIATPAGLLCFGRNPQEVLPHAVVNLTHYGGTTPDATAVFHIERGIGGTLFDQVQRIEDYLHKNTHHGMTVKPDSFERVEIDEYPRVVVRELCVNMLAHRDYEDIYTAARVQLFVNAIEWMNPGGLPEGITVDQLLVTQRSRNPVVFSILWESGLIEGVGQGVDTVVTVLAREQMAPPHFQDLSHTAFVARVQGRPLDVLRANDLYARLSERQQRILTLVRQQGDVSSTDIATYLGGKVTQRSIQRDIKALIEFNFVRTVGNSHATRYRPS